MSLLLKTYRIKIRIVTFLFFLKHYDLLINLLLIIDRSNLNEC